MFQFVVHRLHWLARVPFAPHIFDALLLAWTALFHRKQLAAMEKLEAFALQLPGVRPQRHRFGGAGFVCDGREFAHLHGNGLLDVQLTRERAAAAVAAGRAAPHHVFGPSAWVSFWVRSDADVAKAIHLVALGRDVAAAH